MASHEYPHHHHHHQQQQQNMLPMDMGGHIERARRGGKRGSSSGQKKKPQRGMGVAQLERLRLQEKWKKTIEMSSFYPLNLQYQYYAPNQFHSPEPIPSVPVMHGPGHYDVPSLPPSGLVTFLEPGLIYPRHGNGGGGGCGSAHALIDPYRAGGGGLSLAETSKELSSIPKSQQQWPLVPDRCDSCFKKKRFNEDNIGCNGDERVKYEELSLVNNGYDIPGLKQDKNIDFNGGTKNLDARAARSAFHAGHHTLNEDLKVVAVNRYGNTSMGKNVPMEHEFFPADHKCGGSTCSKELGLPAEAEAEASVAVVGGEAVCITASAYNDDAKAASNSVDLSLKLSY